MGGGARAPQSDLQRDQTYADEVLLLDKYKYLVFLFPVYALLPNNTFEYTALIVNVGFFIN